MSRLLAASSTSGSSSRGGSSSSRKGTNKNNSSNKNKKNEGTNGHHHVLKVIGIGFLLLVSLFSVYTILVGIHNVNSFRSVGEELQQYATSYYQQATAATTGSLLVASSSSSITTGTTTTTTTTDQSSLPHHKRQSSLAMLQNPLGIPIGVTPALPSIRVTTSQDEANRHGATKYGGKGDKQHLGGFTSYDKLGVSPSVWKYMISNLGIKSLLDVGCGKGVSTLFFAEHNVDVLCIEGSHDAVEQTLLPDPTNQVVEHDFSRGPYWPPHQTYDAVWSVEFLEHVGRNYQFNYIQAFRKAALLFVSHSNWGGWHHVEVHRDEWWINKFEMFGFKYSDLLTKKIRDVALDEYHIAKSNPTQSQNIGPDGEYYNAQHIWLTMMVFINPIVATLPEHSHLLAEKGCYQGKEANGQMINRDCSKSQQESELPDSYNTLPISPEQQLAWLTKVKSSIDKGAAA